MQDLHIERMRAIVAQAIAEASQQPEGRLDCLHLIIYGRLPEETIRSLFAEASRGTRAECARLEIEQAGSRYICWNCCGLRFESEDSVCPNCGEAAFEVPDDIDFALRRVEVAASL